MKVSWNKLVIALEWILFIGLSIVSGWFASGVFENFFSKKSSFSQSENEVKTYPVIIIEFRSYSGPISVDDVRIYYK